MTAKLRMKGSNGMFDNGLYEIYNSVQYQATEAVRHFCEGYDPDTGNVSPIMKKRLLTAFKRVGQAGPGMVAEFDNDHNDNRADANLEMQVAFMLFRSTLMNLGVPMEHIVAAAQAE